MSTPTTLIADRYRLVKMLGAGGMGIVWQAWDERLHRPVALKMLRTQPELTDRERQLATDRAMREARISAGLHHPHAVTVFDVVEHEGQPCIVMQLIESTPLSDLLREHGTLTPAETARIGAEIGSALAAAHKMRIVHRDVKPGNILITEDGSAMISDFGISHALGDATITATGMIHGTPAYLAPEVARGQPSSFASDVFSLGSTLYAMLEGSPPFGADKNAIALLHRVARGGYPPPKHAGSLGPLLYEMLATNPKRRPTMASIAATLKELQEPRLPGQTPFPSAVPIEDVPTQPIGGDPAPPPAIPAVDAAAPAIPIAPAAAPAIGPPTPATVPVADAAASAIDSPGPLTIPVVDAAASRTQQQSITRPTVPADGQTLPAPAGQDTTGKTIPVDQPTRYEPPTAETEPLGPPASGPPTGPLATSVPPPKSAPSAPAPKRRRRVGVVVGALVLIGALVVGAVSLFPVLLPDAGQEAAPRVSQSPGGGQTSTAPSPSETEAADSPSAAPSPSAPPSEEEEPEPPPPTAEERVIGTVTGYYGMLPGDLDSAWPLMTADYQQNHAGGRGGYEAFWGAIADVEVADVTVPAPDRAQATLTYYYRDGRVVQEVTAYRFVEEGGVLKIAETDVLSSSRL
ncbi:serine/threonine-protein kinase [Microbacterium sp. DT81.1]|uniref:serine/threonine-protein kinase n=1 Tax=Microbacterium sp. DT81.1 TaxID=3393413 RepID=UPI003CE9C36C